MRATIALCALAASALTILFACTSTASADPECIYYPFKNGLCADQPDSQPPVDPDCPLDPSPGQICVAGPSETFKYVGTDVNGVTVTCDVTLQGAHPSDQQNGNDLIQFRTRAKCDKPLWRITIETHVDDPTQIPIAYGPTRDCHELVNGYGCGTTELVSEGSDGNQNAGPYTLITHARLVLRGGPDPWVSTPGTTPYGSSELCAPGGYVANCELRLEIPANGL